MPPRMFGARARAALALPLFAAVAAGCQVQISDNAYVCGPNADCPPGQACDGIDDTCVGAQVAHPFTCNVVDREPDNSPATATPIEHLTCASTPQEFQSCIEDGDTLDMYSFTAPSPCTSTTLAVELDYQIAYETLSLELTGSDGVTVIATDSECTDATPELGIDGRCISAPLAPGSAYVLVVSTNGSGDCGGACAYNRYSLIVETSD